MILWYNCVPYQLTIVTAAWVRKPYGTCTLNLAYCDETCLRNKLNDAGSGEMLTRANNCIVTVLTWLEISCIGEPTRRSKSNYTSDINSCFLHVIRHQRMCQCTKCQWLGRHTLWIRYVEHIIKYEHSFLLWLYMHSSISLCDLLTQGCCNDIRAIIYNLDHVGS